MIDTPKMSKHTLLESVTYDMLPDYELNGIFDCKIVRVFDGDTFHAAIDLEGKIYRVQCRLKDIDTPEIPRAHIDAMTPVSIKAFRARDRLIELVTNVDIRSLLDTNESFYNTSGLEMPSLSDMDMQSKIDESNSLVLYDSLILEGRDKYGRALATLLVGGDSSCKNSEKDSVNDILVKEGHAITYE